jgi:hypothetical protein
LAVVAFDKEGNRLNGTIDRIFNPDNEGSPLRFQCKTREGVLLEDSWDISSPPRSTFSPPPLTRQTATMVMPTSSPRLRV